MNYYIPSQNISPNWSIAFRMLIQRLKDFYQQQMMSQSNLISLILINKQNQQMSSLSSTESYLRQVQSIKVKDCVKITIDTEFLSSNFELIKQCLSKVSELQSRLNQNTSSLESRVFSRLETLQKSSKSHDKMIEQLSKSLGQDFLKKFQQLEAKSKNSQSIEELVKKLQALDIFVTNNFFKEYQQKNDSELREAMKTKEKLSNFVSQHQLKDFMDSTSTEFQNSRILIGEIRDGQKSFDDSINKIDKKATQAKEQVKQNSEMIKQINFAQMQDRLRKFKDQSESKLTQMNIKIKKKIGTGDLLDLEKVLVDKIDKYLLGLSEDSASRSQTKEALQFLQKRINQIINIVAPKEQDEQDALVATKKWSCVSCAKDLGKYEGKLGQFRPWAVFPARQMNPQMTGGYGYLNYIEKTAYKRGNSIDDKDLQRLSKTFYNQSSPRDKSPSANKNFSSTKTTNFMSAYGDSTTRPVTSLKEEYFKSEKERGNSSKMFRVKKDKAKDQSMNEIGEKQKVKYLV